MASYTRQSSFADGDTITAALFNNEFNQLVNAFHNSTGHSHDGTTAEGPVIGLIGDAGETSPNNKVLIDTTNNFIEFYVQVSSNPVQQLYIADGAIIPVTDSDVDLGTTSLRFKDTYTDTVTTTGNVSVGGNLTVTGTTTFNGGTITMGDAATDNVVFGADVDSNIIPDDDDSYDLGSASQEWRNLYIDGTANIDSLVADTADINGGTVDGAIIGGSSAAAITGTAITGTSFVIGSATITEAELEILDGASLSTDEINLLDGVTATTAELNILDGVTSTAAELNILDGVTSTAAELNILDGVTASAADINLIDGITNGTVIASKAIITDANKDISGGRNITISGELDAATLDISGDADIDGTLEADAITIGGITLAETISDTVGAMVSSNTESNISVTYEDSDNTLDFALPAALEITTSVGVGGGSTNGVVISQGAIAIKNGGTQSYIDFYCESSNAHYARLQAPAHGSFSGNPTLTLPATAGTLALTSSDITGNAATATALATARTIGGVSFDGTGNINLPGVNATGSQATTGNAATATALATARTIHGVSFDGTANIDLSEVVQDTVGAMFSSNTETGIAATYEDGDGTIDLVIGSDVIVNSMIADDAIDSAQIADGSIDTAHIANDQVTGDKLANDITIANNLSVAGNLTVTGTTTQTGSVVSDSNFTGLTDENTGNTTDFGFYGKYVESSTTKYAGLYYDASTDNTFRLFCDTQTVPSTTVNTSATGYAASNLVVNNLTGTIATAAQPNITSLGTLTALTGGTGDFNWDSNTLVVDSSTNRVGIGNAAPDVSLDIGSFTDAMHVPVGTTAQRPTGANGYFRYNSDDEQFEGYADGAWGAIAGSGGDGGVAPSVNTMTGDGSDTTLALSTTPTNENATILTLDGVVQHKSTYSVSGSTLTFSTAPASGVAVECIVINTNTISTATIVQDADTDTKIQVEESSDEDKIRFDTAGTERAVIDSAGLAVTGAATASTSARIAQVAITSSSSAVAWDSVAAANAYHVTTENTTFSAPSNSVEGAIISVELAQGGTARTIAWNTVFEFAASTAPTVTATANKTDIFSFRYNGSVWQEIGRVQNMAQT